MLPIAPDFLMFLPVFLARHFVPSLLSQSLTTH